jgi:hypothetical protein
VGPAVLVLFNAEPAAVTFRLPADPGGWLVRVDSARGALSDPWPRADNALEVADRSVAVLAAAAP